MTKRKNTKNMGKEKSVGKGTGPKSGMTTFERPLAFGNTFNRTTPRMKQSADGLTIRITNTERFAWLPGALTSVSAYYAFNPADTGTLRWLPSIARNYSSYRVHRLRFTFQPSVATTQNGFISTGWFADLLDATEWYSAPSTADLETCTKGNSRSIWSGGVLMELTEKDLHPMVPWYRINPLIDTTSTLTSNVPGALGVSTYFATAAPATISAGIIRVEYDITLANPTPANSNTQFRGHLREDGVPGSAAAADGVPIPVPPLDPVLQPSGSDPRGAGTSGPLPNYLRPVPACHDFGKLQDETGAELL